MTKLEWGTKRTCLSCSARFYDLRKTPIVCPKCGEPFEIQAPGRRTRVRAQAEPEMIDKTKEEDINIDDIDLSEDIDNDMDDEDDDTLIEEDDDMNDDIDEMADVIDTVDEKEEK